MAPAPPVQHIEEEKNPLISLVSVCRKETFVVEESERGPGKIIDCNTDYFRYLRKGTYYFSIFPCTLHIVLPRA